MSQALIDLQITHEELKTIMNEKERYEQMKENIRNIKTNDELSENSSINKKIFRIYKLKKKVISINPSKEKFNIFVEIGKIYNSVDDIKEKRKNELIDERKRKHKKYIDKIKKRNKEIVDKLIKL